jgi:hypothetical protein
MSSTREDLQSFNVFVEQRLGDASFPPSLDELFLQWHNRQHCEQIHESIRRGLSDVEAGRFEPADQAMANGWISNEDTA